QRLGHIPRAAYGQRRGLPLGDGDGRRGDGDRRQHRGRHVDDGDGAAVGGADLVVGARLQGDDDRLVGLRRIRIDQGEEGEGGRGRRGRDGQGGRQGGVVAVGGSRAADGEAHRQVVIDRLVRAGHGQDDRGPLGDGDGLRGDGDDRGQTVLQDF